MAAKSTGPVQVDKPWDAFADDQLGLMDHLGIREFFYMGYCIGGCFAGKLMQRAPDRVVAAVFCQSVGHRPENPTVMYRHSKDNWVPDFIKRRPDVSADTIEKYLHNLYAVPPDFLYSVSRDFIRNCRTPMLVLPDDVPGHPLQTSIDVASLAPNAEITVYPVEGTGGAEATHDRPGAPFSEGARADAGRGAIGEAARRVTATITGCVAAPAYPPMLARSRWCSGFRRNGRRQILRRAGTWRRPRESRA